MAKLHHGNNDCHSTNHAEEHLFEGAKVENRFRHADGGWWVWSRVNGK